MVAKKETYSQAMERLEKIVRQIDNNELDIDILSEKIKEADESGSGGRKIVARKAAV